MEELKELVKNWIRKAENDLKTAKDEIKTENPATDTVCFHAQQCAEKYLKAYLVFHQKHFKKIHNIAKLVELCKEIDENFDKIFGFGASNLTVYAVEIRYSDEIYFPSKEEAEKAIEIAEKVKEFVLEKLKIKEFHP
ncbi:MAG: HEPN domain-containing protein [Thermodesulfobacteriota bacterium]